MDRGFVLIFNGSASVEMPKTNMFICLPVRIKLNQPVSRTQAQGVREPQTAAEQSTHTGTWDIWDSAPKEWEHKCFHQRTSVLIRWTGERDLSACTLLYVSPENSIQGCCWEQKPSEEQCVTECQALPTERSWYGSTIGILEVIRILLLWQKKN